MTFGSAASTSWSRTGSSALISREILTLEVDDKSHHHKKYYRSKEQTKAGVATNTHSSIDMQSQTLTNSLTHSVCCNLLTHSLTHSVTHSHTHSLIHPLTLHLFSHLPIPSLTPVLNSFFIETFYIELRSNQIQLRSNQGYVQVCLLILWLGFH